MAAMVNKIEPRYQSNDCGAWALKTYLGIHYDEVWTMIVELDRCKGRNGLWPATIKRVAKALGFPLRLKRTPDLNEDYGLLLVEDKDDGHVAVLRNGLIFDVDSTVWEVESWLDNKGYKVKEGLLTSADNS